MIETVPTYVKSLVILISAYYGISLLKLLTRNIIYPIFFSQRSKIKKYGDWAVVTGATDGIGKGFVYALAKDGLNLIIISRTKSKLEDLAKEIGEKYQVKIKIIDCDYTKVDIYDRIEKEINGLKIGLLVNNVGMSLPHPDYFGSTAFPKFIDNDLIHCNCNSVVQMTRIIMQQSMNEHGGFIINISSGSGELKTPFLATYAATKAFVDTFSGSLNSELKNSKQHKNIEIMNVAPYLVSTKMSRARPNAFMIPTANSYAESVLNRLGTVDFTNGCLSHELQCWFMRCLPEFVKTIGVYKSTYGIMKRAKAKAAKKN